MLSALCPLPLLLCLTHLASFVLALCPSTSTSPSTHPSISSSSILSPLHPISSISPRSRPVLSKRLVTLPYCARACIEDFISRSFPRVLCPDQNDLRCLCTTKSLTGLTLGEGSLQCLASDCPDEDSPAKYEATYEICEQVPGHQPATHKTLTASMSKPALTVVASNGASTTTPSTTFRTSRSVSSTPPAAASTGIIVDTSLQSNPTTLHFSGTASTYWASEPTSSAKLTRSLATYTSTTASTAASTTSAAAGSAAATSLNVGQVVGISVAGGAVFFAAMGVLLFLFFAKRRRGSSRRKSSSSFGDDRIPSNFRTTPQMRTMEFPIPPSGGAVAKAISPKPAKVLGEAALSRFGNQGNVAQPPGPEATGLAIASEAQFETRRAPSPTSIMSYQTTSRLLPEMPQYQIPKASDQSTSLQPRMQSSQAPIGQAISSFSQPLLSANHAPRQLTSNNQSSSSMGDDVYIPVFLQTAEPPPHFASDSGSAILGGEPRRWSPRDVPLPRLNTAVGPSDLSKPFKPVAGKPGYFAVPTAESRGHLSKANTALRQGYADMTWGGELEPESADIGGLAAVPQRLSTAAYRPQQGTYKASDFRQTHSYIKRSTTYFTDGSDTSFEDESATAHRTGLAQRQNTVFAESDQKYFKPQPGLADTQGLPTRAPSQHQAFSRRILTNSRSSSASYRQVPWSRYYASPSSPTSATPLDEEGPSGPFELPARNSGQQGPSAVTASAIRRQNQQQQSQVPTAPYAQPTLAPPRPRFQASAKEQILCSPTLGGNITDIGPSKASSRS